MTLDLQIILIHTLNQEFGISPGMMGTHPDTQVPLGLSGSFPSVLVSALSQFLHGCCSCTETSRKGKSIYDLQFKAFLKIFLPPAQP